MNGFHLLVRAFNRGLNDAFPLVPYRDSLGRNRTAGRARRARAEAVLQALTRRQAQVRSRTVYEGLDGLGARCHRSRSTAYRAVVDLVAAQLLERESGGGKTHDAGGDTVAAANGYRVPAHLLGEGTPRRPRKPRPTGRPAELSRRAEDLVDDARARIERRQRGDHDPPPAPAPRPASRPMTDLVDDARKRVEGWKRARRDPEP